MNSCRILLVRIFSNSSLLIAKYSLYRLECYLTEGRLAQLARASRLHREGRGFESLSAHTDVLLMLQAS